MPNLHKIDEGVRLLPCHVTDAEKLKYGELAAGNMADIDNEQEKIEAARASAKGKIGTLTANVGRLMNIIRTGVENREVGISFNADYHRAVMITIREDTGEELSTRPLTVAEMQKRFDFEGNTPFDVGVTQRFTELADDEGDEQDGAQ